MISSVSRLRKGAAIGIPIIKPWDEPVIGTELLDAVSTGVLVYSKMQPHQADATALWSVFTHLADRFDVSPKLIVNSAQKRSGKSRRQFADAFERYLSPGTPYDRKQTVGTSGAQGFRGSQADFQNVGGETSDVLNNPEKPSVSAAADVPTVENRPGGVGTENITPERASDAITDAEANDAPISPNGAASPRKSRRRTLIADKIQEAARQHPDWSLAQIGEHCGRSESFVRHVIEGGQQPAGRS